MQNNTQSSTPTSGIYTSGNSSLSNSLERRRQRHQNRLDTSNEESHSGGATSSSHCSGSSTSSTTSSSRDASPRGRRPQHAQTSSMSEWILGWPTQKTRGPSYQHRIVGKKSKDTKKAATVPSPMTTLSSGSLIAMPSDEDHNQQRQLTSRGSRRKKTLQDHLQVTTANLTPTPPSLISPMTADITETPDDSRFQAIGMRSPGQSTAVMTTATDYEESNNSLQSAAEDPLGHVIPPPPPRSPSPPIVVRPFQPALDVYSPTNSVHKTRLVPGDHVPEDENEDTVHALLQQSLETTYFDSTTATTGGIQQPIFHDNDDDQNYHSSYPGEEKSVPYEHDYALAHITPRLDPPTTMNTSWENSNTPVASGGGGIGSTFDLSNTEMQDDDDRDALNRSFESFPSAPLSFHRVRSSEDDSLIQRERRREELRAKYANLDLDSNNMVDQRSLEETYPMQRLVSDPAPQKNTSMMEGGNHLHAATATAFTILDTSTTATNQSPLRKSMSFEMATTAAAVTRTQPPPLSWRMNPTESLSDWKIQVFDQSSKQFTTYHVHKAVLCVGSRACGYLSQRKTLGQIRLPLIRKACQIFPQVLDFCYAAPDFQIMRASAVGLVFLATLLNQPQLLGLSMEYVYRELCGDEAADLLHVYLADAIYFDQAELVEYILELSATHILEMPDTSRLLEELSTAQFVKVLQQIPMRQSSTSPEVSTLVVEYCIPHRLEVTLEFVESCASLCPVLTTDAALALLELYLALGGGAVASGIYHAHSSGTNDERRANRPLLHRCLDVLAHDSASLLKQPVTIPQLVSQLLESCPRVLASWTRELLEDAHQHGSQIHSELTQAWERQALAEEELEETKKKLEETQAERNRLQKTLESTKQELRQQLDGWMNKSHRDATEHATRQGIWQEERDLWRLERQAWLEERGALEHELYRIKAQMTRQREESEIAKQQQRKQQSTSKKKKKKHPKDSNCPQVQSQTQGILDYLSTVSMPGGPGEDTAMQVSDDSYSAELNVVES